MKWNGKPSNIKNYWQLYLTKKIPYECIHILYFVLLTVTKFSKQRGITSFKLICPTTKILDFALKLTPQFWQHNTARITYPQQTIFWESTRFQGNKRHTRRVMQIYVTAPAKWRLTIGFSEVKGDNVENNEDVSACGEYRCIGALNIQQRRNTDWK